MKKFVYVLLFCVSFVTAQEKNSAEAVVQKQVEAYNEGNLDAFLETYSNDVKVYNFPKNYQSLNGKEKVKEVFGNLFKKYPNLHRHIQDRIVTGDTILDHEKITFSTDEPIQKFVTMYIVENEKIKIIHFLKRN
ncbi:hypothetical protein IMCC3317_20710 [Kordia antarctica]|uniref:SnoaL-like domain-containing protein n=1 Tax=Kordia antarctica TaxID=1218801 RepID=A0A7L4ZKG2_9FLAO|nr:nuclear transport factor 2 family protein [Kordia antarctica]QHI36706.1 hypothetical protein IMCC3317_20710 [Kordia antarctica]